MQVDISPYHTLKLKPVFTTLNICRELLEFVRENDEVAHDIAER